MAGINTDDQDDSYESQTKVAEELMRKKLPPYVVSAFIEAGYETLQVIAEMDTNRSRPNNSLQEIEDYMNSEHHGYEISTQPQCHFKFCPGHIKAIEFFIEEAKKIVTQKPCQATCSTLVVSPCHKGYRDEPFVDTKEECPEEFPLYYLPDDWLHIVKQMQTTVQLVKGKGGSIGEPSESEMRLLLIECKGDRKAAEKKCVENRKRKISELYEKIGQRFDVQWVDAVQALTQHELNVEDAFSALQWNSLQALYHLYLTTGINNNPSTMKSKMEFYKETLLDRIKQINSPNKMNSCLRMVMVEFRLELEKAKILIKLLEDTYDDDEYLQYPLLYYIDATKSYSTFDDAFKYLHQPCLMCADDYPMDEMVVMPSCGESLCKQCFRQYFSMVIREKSVKHLVCPMCGGPDMNVNGPTLDMNIQLFVALVKNLLQKCDYELCQKKLTDFHLSKVKDFIWCASKDCGAGFINETNRTKIKCPNCFAYMCFLCRQEWEDQHEGISCEMFAKWKNDNDPEAQKAGLAAILIAKGIHCPSCKFRYELAKGGCMHFHCTQCPCEFCYGCLENFFKSGNECGKGYCKKGASGLHADHPRDCLFYLRDFSIPQLQGLLIKNNVNFDTDPPEAQIAAAKERKEQGNPIVPVAYYFEEEVKPKAVHIIDGQEIELACQVMLQKVTPDGLKDEECLRDAPPKMGGLCQTHYKEYLVSKINKFQVDPAELYEVHQLKLILRREELPIPEKEDDETYEEYKEKLIKSVQQTIPLKVRPVPPPLNL